MELTVRSATADDARAIGAVHMQCWREAYSHLLSVGFFDRRTPEQAAERWTHALATLPDGQSVHVATADGRIVGFSSSGKSRDEPPVRELELWSLYLLAEHHGFGLGQRLLDAALGDAPASLWMAKRNPRAHAFYRRNGFVPDGLERSYESWENLEEIRLVR
ncbi:GNAT family N-acetyltransferase [Lysobacter korlensis]|uniref:GNAT family N-acetyltransferase n=1 Tax=Lysobacter korlensis TaxID=553636 RepID=A0ABV6RUL6_9GAMM